MDGALHSTCCPPVCLGVTKISKHDLSLLIFGAAGRANPLGTPFQTVILLPVRA